MKISIVVLVVTICCIFSFGYCLATESAPVKSPTHDSKVDVAPAKSVSEIQSADATAANVVSLKNDAESANFQTYAVDNKKVIDITVPQGQQLVIDNPIYADVINIHGDGDIVLADSGSIGMLPQSDITSSIQIGANTQTYVSSGTVQLVESIGPIPITPIANKPIEIKDPITMPISTPPPTTTYFTPSPSSSNTYTPIEGGLGHIDLGNGGNGATLVMQTITTTIKKDPPLETVKTVKKDPSLEAIRNAENLMALKRIKENSDKIKNDFNEPNIIKAPVNHPDVVHLRTPLEHRPYGGNGATLGQQVTVANIED